MKLEVTLFENAGIQNTEETLKIAKKFAEENNITDIVVASTTGETGIKASEIFDVNRINLVVVTHAHGFVKLGYQEMPEENRQKLLDKGVKVLTAGHALSGAERSFRRALGVWLPVELFAKFLRSTVCDGFKVCIEISAMAADAGLVPVDKDIIAIGGTGKGSDTAVLLKPADSSNLFEMKVRAILCKPREF
ncbi:MAG: pyruvate kinase alpha/beta domain-containing protein [Candidatus Freyarchaeota archaeon]|nr:pyruvate kinase alpha/beta domain-containing protein [Candidatus Freyarchaeota archaeon]